jgi:hypothetical protein
MRPLHNFLFVHVFAIGIISRVDAYHAAQLQTVRLLHDFLFVHVFAGGIILRVDAYDVAQLGRLCEKQCFCRPK